MENSDFDDTLKKLSEKVSELTVNNTVKNKPKMESKFLSNVNVKSSLYYGCIPIIIMIIFLIWKPGFVMEEISIDGNLPEKRLSLKKVLFGVFIFTVIISVIIYVKNQKSK